jgi:hypothetical protein
MGSGCDNAGKGLVRNRTDINHSEIVFSESNMKIMQGNARLGEHITLFDIDLGTKLNQINKKTCALKLKFESRCR